MTITVYPPYGSSSNNPVYVEFNPTATDAFGRLQVSEPYTLFDSQNRYAIDNQFDTSTSGTGTTSFLTNEASVKNGGHWSRCWLSCQAVLSILPLSAR